MEATPTTPAPVSTQEANPANAVARTVFAVILALFPIVNGTLVAVNEWAVANADMLPGWLFPIVNGALIVAAMIAGLVTKVLAVPGVNDWLRSGKFRSILAPDTTGKHTATEPVAPATDGAASTL